MHAETTWLLNVFCRFLPRVSTVIQETGIIVISARTEFEDVFPGDYYKWKIEAFKNLKRNYDEDVKHELPLRK